MPLVSEVCCAQSGAVAVPTAPNIKADSAKVLKRGRVKRVAFLVTVCPGKSGKNALFEQPALGYYNHVTIVQHGLATLATSLDLVIVQPVDRSVAA